MCKICNFECCAKESFGGCDCDCEHPDCKIVCKEFDSVLDAWLCEQIRQSGQCDLTY